MLGVEMTSELPKAILEFSETARNSALVKSAMVLASECVHYHISGKNLNPKAGGWKAAQGVYVLASDRGHELGFTGGFIVGEPNADWWRARMVSSDSDLGNKRAKHLIVARFDNMGNVDTTVIILLGTELKIEALTYIRGRSIPKGIIIIDEAQNLTPHEVKTIVTRAGQDTKIIFTGDPYQIDNPYLDANSNGLTYLAEKFKNEKLAGHVTLEKGERSALAELAARLL
jgi:hypothetical protein